MRQRRARHETGCGGFCTRGTPDLQIPAGALDRKIWLDRVARRRSRSDPTVEVQIACDLASRCRSLSADANELERELAIRVAAYAPRLLDLKAAGC